MTDLALAERLDTLIEQNHIRNEALKYLIEKLEENKNGSTKRNEKVNSKNDG